MVIDTHIKAADAILIFSMPYVEMKLLSVEKSTRPEKRLMATFEVEDGKEKTVHFGLRGGSTYIDHKDDLKKQNYIARHTVNEDWTVPDKAGTLSRFILWNKKTLPESVEDYRRRFKM